MCFSSLIRNIIEACVLLFFFFLFFLMWDSRRPLAQTQSADSASMYKHDVYFTHQKSKSSLCPVRVGFPGFREASLSSARRLQAVVESRSQRFQNSWKASPKSLCTMPQWCTSAELEERGYHVETVHQGETGYFILRCCKLVSFGFWRQLIH